MAEIIDVMAIGRCTVKGCKSRKRHTVIGTVERWPGVTTTRISFRAPSGRLATPYSVWGGEAPYVADLAAYKGDQRAIDEWLTDMLNMGWICLTHRKVMKVTPINAIYREDKVCDWRCVNAVGPTCECECAGKNHGGKWD